MIEIRRDDFCLFWDPIFSCLWHNSSSFACVEYYAEVSSSDELWSFAGNEGEVGKALKYGMEELKIPRSEIFVTSKLWNTFHAPQDVEPAFHKSLEALGLEYLDLYLMHWPVCFKNLNWTTNFPTNPDGSIIYDLENHPNDTYLAMEKLVEKGLAKSIGLSNFNSKQIEDVLGVCKVTKIPFFEARFDIHEKYALYHICKWGFCGVEKNTPLFMYSVQQIFLPLDFVPLGHLLDFDIFLVMTICKCQPKVLKGAPKNEKKRNVQISHFLSLFSQIRIYYSR